MKNNSKEALDQIFAGWVDNHSEQLLNRACFMISNKEDAKDLVQDVFMVAYSKLETFESNSSPYTWLSAILQNKISDMYRKKYKSSTTTSFDSTFSKHGEWIEEDVLNSWDGLESSNILDDEEFNLIFDGCIDKLPEKWKFVIQQSYLQEQEATNICGDMDISLNNYWKILQRSRLQLRKCIDTNWFKFDI